jgi:integrase
MSYTCVKKTWWKICIQAGIADLHLHDFRSFAASEGHEYDVDARITKVILGHSDSRTTEKRYLRVRKSKTAEAAEIISAPIVKAFTQKTKGVMIK